MSTLLLRLAAPLQSWGADSKFERRTTGREPTKSGVLGLLAAALGRRRNEPIDDLARLKFGVRTDKPGQVMTDFHIASNKDRTYVTRRYYLEDAAFLVGLEGNMEFLRILEAAVTVPYFPLFLGRRSCPPAGRICLGVRDIPLVDALKAEPPICAAGMDVQNMTIVLDSDMVGAHRQRDLPISFNPRHRKFSYRFIEIDVSGLSSENSADEYGTTHDAFEYCQVGDENESGQALQQPKVTIGCPKWGDA